MRGGRSLLGKISERRQVAVRAFENLCKIGRHLGINRLQVDNAVALHYTEAEFSVCFESNDFHFLMILTTG
jgi:hypothetical protein